MNLYKDTLWNLKVITKVKLNRYLYGILLHNALVISTLLRILCYSKQQRIFQTLNQPNFDKYVSGIAPHVICYTMKEDHDSQRQIWFWQHHKMIVILLLWCWSSISHAECNEIGWLHWNFGKYNAAVCGRKYATQMGIPVC